MPRLTLKELRTALKVLERIDADVPSQLFVTISDQIRDIESHKRDLQMSRMTEDQLMRLDSRVPNRLRITTPDGRIVQGKRNEETFLSALQLIPIEQLATLDINVRKHDLIFGDGIAAHRRKGYRRLSCGLYAYNALTLKERHQILEAIDAHLQLGWEIEIL